MLITTDHVAGCSIMHQGKCIMQQQLLLTAEVQWCTMPLHSTCSLHPPGSIVLTHCINVIIISNTLSIPRTRSLQGWTFHIDLDGLGAAALKGGVTFLQMLHSWIGMHRGSIVDSPVEPVHLRTAHGSSERWKHHSVTQSTVDNAWHTFAAFANTKCPAH